MCMLNILPDSSVLQKSIPVRGITQWGLRSHPIVSQLRNPYPAFPGGFYDFYGRIYPRLGRPHGGFGVSTCSEHKLQINVLEFKTVILALQHWVSVLHGHHVMIATDNSTVVAYINKQGGTHSHALLRLVVDLFLWLQTQDIVIRARHIPGCLRVIADSLSLENQPITTECPQHASSPVYFSSSGALSMVIDALSQDWQGRLMYMFPQVFLPAQHSHSEAQDHSGGWGDTHSPLVAVKTVVATPAVPVCEPPTIRMYRRDLFSQRICLERQVIPSARMEALMQHYQTAGFSKVVF